MKKISILLAALVAMACIVGVASAAPKKKVLVPSEITLKFKDGGDDYYEDGDLFSGKVSSKKKRCQVDRKVKVFNKNGGRVGKDKTDKQGRYAISVENVGPGKYFAEVKKRSIEKRKKVIVCEAATSDRVRVR